MRPTTITNNKRRSAIQFEMRKLFQDVYPNRKDSEIALKEAMRAFTGIKRDLMFKRLFEQ